MADLTTRTLGDTSKGAPLTNEEVDQNFINLRDDPRNSDSREWTGSTVSQSEAEAGTDTTRRAWTAQRVKQAINKLLAPVIATVNTKLGSTEKAVDSDKLDGLNGSQFLRSDTNDTMSGRLNIGGSDDGVNQLQVDGDTALRGNAGVNTDDPTHALDVAGAVRVRNENPVFFGGAGASDAKFEMRYNAATQSLDFNYLG